MKKTYELILRALCLTSTICMYGEEEGVQEAAIVEQLQIAESIPVEQAYEEADVAVQQVEIAKIGPQNQVVITPNNNTPDPVYTDFSSNYDSYQTKVVTPSASAVKNGCDIALFVDYLYWYAREEGLGYAFSGAGLKGVDPTTNSTLPNGTSYAPHSKMKSGFKAGFAVAPKYDGWDLDACYTWLHSSADSSVSRKANQVLTPTWAIASQVQINSAADLIEIDDLDTELVSANTKWKLHFNVADLALGRNFFVSPKLALRPHFGLKSSWQTQKYNVNYNSLEIGGELELGLANVNSPYEEYQVRNIQKYWGLGLSFGLDSSWLFTKNWGLFGNVAVSSLWGQFTNQRNDTTTVYETNLEPDDVQTITSVNVSGVTPIIANAATLSAKKRIHTINPVLEAMMGFRYDKWFSSDAMRVRLELAWEEQYWFNQNQFGLATDAMLGNLIFQGVTVKLRFDF